MSAKPPGPALQPPRLAAPHLCCDHKPHFSQVDVKRRTVGHLDPPSAAGGRRALGYTVLRLPLSQGPARRLDHFLAQIGVQGVVLPLE